MERISRRGLALFGILGILACAGAEGPAQKPSIDPKAEQILKQMCSYLGSLKQFAFEGEETFDEVLDNGQKLQFSHQRKLAVQRPSRIVAEFHGDLADRFFYFNGQTGVLFDKDKNVYGHLDFKGTVDGLIETLHEKFGFSLPLSDLVLTDPYKLLTQGVTSGSYLGVHNVAGVKCHHLAFTQKLVDWQIWIETGDRPLPRKLLINQKQMRGEPQFTAVLSHWDLAPKLTDAMFDFTPPKDARKIEFLKVTITEQGKPTPPPSGN